MNTQPRELMRQLECEPINLLVICDILRDNDDELALVLASYMARHGYVDLRGVVANYTQSHLRARAAKGALKLLELESVPVAPGTTCRSSGMMLDYETNVPYLAEESELFVSAHPHESAGMNLMRRVLENADDHSITLLCISGLTDLAELIRRYPYDVKNKLRRVVIMGGLKNTDGYPHFSDFDHLIPDDAANNEFDWFASYYVHAQLLEMKVPMIIVSKEAAYAAQMPFDLYNKAKQTRHLIGMRLADAQQASLEWLWRRTWMSPLNPQRDLPDRCDPQWFRYTFLGERGTYRTENDTIWDLASRFQLYDPIALVACFPKLVTYFFDPLPFDHSPAYAGAKNAENCVIGAHRFERPAVTRPVELVSFLREGIVQGLSDAMQR